MAMTLQAPARPRALVVTAKADGAQDIGLAAYSYAHAFHAFRPLLERYAPLVVIDRGESRLDGAIDAARREGRAPLHLSFLPLERVYPSSLAPTVAFPYWEFPDIPSRDFDDNPRNNWRRICGALAGLICASEFTADAFRRAGVAAPIHVVPPPGADPYFALPPRPPGEHRRLDCAAHVLAPGPPGGAAHTHRQTLQRLGTASRALFDHTVQPRLPLWLDRSFGEVGRVGRRILAQAAAVPPPDVRALDLSGVVFTAVLNPFDERKNWEDLLSAFLLALRDADDATLVLKLAVSPALAGIGLRTVLGIYRTWNIRHRCRVAIINEYLSPAAMLALTEASTFLLTATRAEGACLPARDFLAAGRPLIAPAHTALAEYVDGEVAWVVAAHPEPTHWPQDPSQRLVTTWQRIVWQSLHDQIRAAYDAAASGDAEYARRAAHGRARMRDTASAAAVWPRLQAALDAVVA